MVAAKIAVVVVNWEQAERSLRCLRSVQAAPEAELLLILVDNGSAQDLAEIRSSVPTAHVLRLESNRGYAAGCNAGAQHATSLGATHLLFLNNDASLEASTLTAFMSAAAIHPDAILAPKIVYADHPERVWSAGGALRRPWMENHHIGRDEPAASHSISRRVDWATGCAFFCAVETYERVGRLDEGFFLYLEDLDWCLRAARRRVEVWYIPEAVVQHEVSATTRHLPRPEVLYYGCRNTYRVAFRHNGRWRRFAMLPGFLITLARVAGRNATSSSYRRDAFYRARSLAILDFALGRTGACPASVPGVGAVPAAHGAKA